VGLADRQVGAAQHDLKIDFDELDVEVFVVAAVIRVDSDPHLRRRGRVRRDVVAVRSRLPAIEAGEVFEFCPCAAAVRGNLDDNGIAGLDLVRGSPLEAQGCYCRAGEIRLARDAGVTARVWPIVTPPS